MRPSLSVIGLTLIAAFHPACSASPTDPGPGGNPVAFATVFQSGISGVRASGQEVIITPERWRQVWQEIGSPDPVPAIDFSREMVILAAMGTQPDSCSRIAVEAMALTVGGLDVRVRETVGGPGCGCATVLTHPVHAVRLERIDRRAGFQVSRQVPSCG